MCQLSPCKGFPLVSFFVNKAPNFQVWKRTDLFTLKFWGQTSPHRCHRGLTSQSDVWKFRHLIAAGQVLLPIVSLISSDNRDPQPVVNCETTRCSSLHAIWTLLPNGLHRTCEHLDMKWSLHRPRSFEACAEAVEPRKVGGPIGKKSKNQKFEHSFHSFHS